MSNFAPKTALMRIVKSFLLLCCLLFLLPAKAEEAGVSWKLAHRRAQAIDSLSYTLTFDIPSDRKQPVTGKVAIHFTLKEHIDVLLDFQGGLGPCSVNGRNRGLDYENEHIVIPKRLLRDGDNVVELSFTSLDKALNRHDSYMYTLFVPANARSVFPCFDQPDLKAMFTATLNVPQGWTTMTSSTSRPLPTYLFSFVAGRFQERTATVGGRKMRALYRETDPQKLNQLPKVFDMAAHSIDWLERYTGIPYPFDSYGMVILPGYQFGGMEHPGAIQLTDHKIFLGNKPSQEELLTRQELIAHETAHMWFGDLVTMKWFDDVWTKEAFANFLADKIVRERFPSINHDLNFLQRYQARAMATDRTDGTHPIKQRLDNLNQAGLLYGNIIYGKAPVVMRKLETLIGAKQLQSGLKRYLSFYAFGNATWDDLMAILDEENPDARVKQFSNVWVKEKGMPTIHIDYIRGKLVVSQADPYGRGLNWRQRIVIMLGYDLDGGKIQAIELTRPVAEISIPKKPDFIIPNYDGQAYGRFTLSDEYMQHLPKRLMCTPDEINRYAIAQTLFDNFLMRRLKSAYFGEMYRQLEKEPNPMIITTLGQHMLRVARSEPQKSRKQLEMIMLDAVKHNKEQACRQTILRMLSTSAVSPDVVDYVYRLWQQHRDPLFNERDYMDMAYHLAITKPGQWRDIVNRQRQRIKNADLLREFDYVSRACNPDAGVQRGLFEQLLDPENRRVEPWAAKLLSLLCCSQREQQSTPYIWQGLKELQEIQQTGDIFFPSAWLRSLLGDHRSQEARQKVKDFLESRPDYPENLRLKLQEEAFPLLNGR